MKPFGLDLDTSEVGVFNLDSDLIFFPAQLGFHLEAGVSPCISDKIDNDLMANKRPASPILSNKRE